MHQYQLIICVIIERLSMKNNILGFQTFYILLELPSCVDRLFLVIYIFKDCGFFIFIIFIHVNEHLLVGVDAHALFDCLSTVVSSERVDGRSLKVSSGKDFYFTSATCRRFFVRELCWLLGEVLECKLQYGFDLSWRKRDNLYRRQITLLFKE